MVWKKNPTNAHHFLTNLHHLNILNGYFLWFLFFCMFFTFFFNTFISFNHNLTTSHACICLFLHIFFVTKSQWCAFDVNKNVSVWIIYICKHYVLKAFSSYAKLFEFFLKRNWETLLAQLCWSYFSRSNLFRK